MNHLQVLMNPMLILGTFFCVVATIGILRLPDVFLRMHAASKASTLGLMFISAATAMKYSQPPIVAKCVLIMVFLFLTAPVSAHLIGRAARMRKNPMCSKTGLDEYDLI